MPTHYVYRMDHDTGFAPHTQGHTLTLCGCKSTTVERWARPGCWVIGIGGNNTGNPDRLIYAMRVTSNPTVGDLRNNRPNLANYLCGHGISEDAPILVSNHFHYFGNKAPELPQNMVNDLLIRTQGCKEVSDEAIRRLEGFLSKMGCPGVYGHPNNPNWKQKSGKCGCAKAPNCNEKAKRASAA